jgi:translation elongation factor P/translation initiation factor 5A
MFAQVQDGAIVRTGFSVQKMFPNVSFSGMPNSQFLTENNIQDVVEAERKDRLYYYVTQEDVVLVDGVPTQQYTNTAMAVEDVDAVDSDGNPIYVQEYDASANGGEGAMVDTSVQMITRGLKYSFKNRIKSQANSALAGTDWMVIRKAERSVEIPAATVTYRAAVITEYDRLKVAITGAADVDALAVVMGAQNWPVEAI